ncbi:MAG: class I SAM-dependent methyltransferase [Janthinobacterium lividum]
MTRVNLDQIDVAKERMKKVGLENVTFIQGDIYALNNSYFNSADLVYARFVLMHLMRPREALTQIHNLLKSDGVFVSQESIMKTSYSSIKIPELEDYTETLIALGAHKGVDYNIGDKLKNLCTQSYFKKVDTYFIQQRLKPQQVKFILLKRIDEWSDKAIEANLTTLDNIEKWQNAIEEFSKYDSPVYYAIAKQAYTLAWK